jgi:PQQ system protein
MPCSAHATLLAALLGLLLSGCEYAGLLRPSVLRQIDPPVTRLVNELPELDQPNDAIIARLYATGGLSHAEPGSDGLMRASITVPPGQMIWKPAIIVMPHGGDLELTFFNRDSEPHAAFLPSNGDRQVLELPAMEGGKAKVRLDGPAMYWFGCPLANHVGRNMLGFILVKGDAPVEARLDRPPQPRPERED